jgi:hypothetical protein
MRTYKDKNQVILSGLYSQIQSLVEYHDKKCNELEKNISDTELLEDEINKLDKIYTKNLKFIYDIINNYQTLKDNEKRHSEPLVNPDYLKSFVK